MAGFVIENKGGSITDQQQSVGNERDFDIIQTGNSRVDCVLEGCVVTAQASPNELLVAVSNGSVLTNGVLKAVAGVTGGSGLFVVADSSQRRISVVVVDSTGALAVRAGTPASFPLMPTLSANDVPLAAIFLLPTFGDPQGPIGAADITDKRMLIENGPITLYKTIAAETTNTTAAAIHVLNKASSGVVIPKGLMLTGRILRCTIGGTMKCTDAGSNPTVKLDILYGGTSVYTETSGITMLEATALVVWFLTFDILAQSATDLTMNGKMYCTALGGLSRTAPTTGNGPSWGTANAVWAFSGSSTSSNAADRTLAVTLTFSVSDNNNEVITELATLEIL